jgi:hypothetical protein
MNRVADALSWRPRIFFVMPLQTNLREKILTLQHDRLLRFRGRIYVPPNDELRSLILKEAHRAVYMAHP